MIGFGIATRSGILVMPILMVSAIAPAAEFPTVRVSVSRDGLDPDKPSAHPSISYEGHRVAFHSQASNLVVGNGNGFFHVYVRGVYEQVTARVSVAPSGEPGNGDSSRPSISSDGSFVAFESWAENLVEDDDFFSLEVFVYSRFAGRCYRASVASDGTPGNGNSYEPAMALDDRVIAFTSLADNLVAGDENEASDVFVRERYSNRTRRVSVSSLGVEGDGASYSPEVSPDGRYVVFISNAENLVSFDGNGRPDVFVHDLESRQTSMASFSTIPSALGGQFGAPTVSNSSFGVMAFTSNAPNLFAGDSNHAWDAIFKTLPFGSMLPASRTSDGFAANGSTLSASINALGRYIAFSSDANNLSPADDNAYCNLFVHDRITGTTMLAAAGLGGEPANGDCNGFNSEPGTRWMSESGRYVAVCCTADNLIEGDENQLQDVFLVDRGRPNDYNVDGAINRADYRSLVNCLRKPGQRAGFGCNAFDQDSDGDTDLADIADFQNAFIGGF